METALQTSYQCPYGPDECPKVEDAKDEIKDMKTDIRSIKRILWIIIGFTLGQYGILIS